MFGETRHADTGSHPHVVAREFGKPVQLLAKPIAERIGCRVPVPDRHDGKLVAAQTDGDNFVGPFDRLQDFGDGFQQEITDVMTERIVHALEMIQIYQEKAELLAGQPCPVQHHVPVG